MCRCLMMEGVTETNINQSQTKESGVIAFLHRTLLILKQDFVYLGPHYAAIVNLLKRALLGKVRDEDQCHPLKGRDDVPSQVTLKPC